MDKDVLVATDFATGGKFVEALDNSTLPISVALWLRLPQYGDWRFALASRRLDSAQPAEAYGLVHDALGAAGLTLENTLQHGRSLYKGSASPFWQVQKRRRHAFGWATHRRPVCRGRVGLPR